MEWGILRKFAELTLMHGRILFSNQHVPKRYSPNNQDTGNADNPDLHGDFMKDIYDQQTILPFLEQMRNLILHKDVLDLVQHSIVVKW